MWTNPFELAQAVARGRQQQPAQPAMPGVGGNVPRGNMAFGKGAGRPGAGMYGTDVPFQNHSGMGGQTNAQRVNAQQTMGQMSGYPSPQGLSAPRSVGAQPMQVQNLPPAPGVFNQNQTQDAANRARNQFAGTTIPMLLSQAQRPGIRADSMLPSVLPDFAQAQAGGQLAAQMVPFQHAQANAAHNLGMQNNQWLEALGFGNAALQGQNQLNQFQLGNMNSLADFFRLFLT